MTALKPFMFCCVGVFIVIVRNLQVRIFLLIAFLAFGMVILNTSWQSRGMVDFGSDACIAEN
jgi:hypothetical protein